MFIDPGMTVPQLAQRYRVGEDRIRTWIRNGELRAVNTSEQGMRPRFVITIDSLHEFERKRSAAAQPKTKRRKRKAQEIDFYPD